MHPKKWIFITLTVLLIGSAIFPLSGSYAQNNGATATPSVGTRIPPTLVPTPVGFSADNDINTVELSGLVRLQQDGVLRVGTPYNVEPFAWLDESGALVGFEVDAIRAIAEEIGVEVEFVQITAETATRLLLNGEVDLLIGQQIKTRQSHEFYDFSHIYYDNRQKIVVRQADAGAFPSIAALNNQRVGIVAGSRGEEAINVYMARNGIGFDLIRFVSQDTALDALEAGEIVAVIGEWDDLNRAGRLGMSYIPEDLQLDLYGIAMRRYDVNLKNLINRSLQRLAQNGTLATLAGNYFTDRDPVNFAAFIPIYNGNATDTRTVSDFPPDVPIPQNSVIEKIRAGESLTVVGLAIMPENTEQDLFLDAINRAVIEEMAQRWGVTVSFLPNSVSNGVDLLANGQADLAIGIQPRWDGADRVDYSVPYFYTGNRVLVLETSQFDTLEDFRRGSFMGYFADAPDDQAYLESLDATFSLYRFADNAEARQMFNTRDIDGAYGDVIRLLSFMDANGGYPWLLIGGTLGQNPFQPITLAVPRNDVDFLTLVNWTLSDMYYDGTLERLWREQGYAIDTWVNYGIDALPWIPIYPGIGDFLTQRIYN